jgi:nucleotide-binding universal stress UspA family protein
VHTHAHERLCAIVRNCNLDVEGLETEAEVEVGRPSDVVLEHAALRRADLIAIAAHRPHGIAEHLRGTTADAVLRHANVAILTVPAELDDSDESSE